MDFSQVALNQGLTFLAWVTGVAVLVVAGFLVKLLIDLSKLSKNLNETTMVLNKELKPTLEALSETLKTVNEFVQRTDKGVGSIKTVVNKVLDKTKFLSGSILGGLLKGFVTVLSLFVKK